MLPTENGGKGCIMCCSFNFPIDLKIFKMRSWIPLFGIYSSEMKIYDYM